MNEEELELPVEQRADVVEEGVLRAEGVDIGDVEGFEAYLEEQGIPVEAVHEVEKLVEEKLDVEREDVEVIEKGPHGEEPVVELEYVQPEDREIGVLHGIGIVAGGYAALVAAGHDGELLEATILDPEHRPYGTFDVLTAWAEEYNEEVTTAREYGSKPWTAASSE